jgi:hypothetical protein
MSATAAREDLQGAWISVRVSDAGRTPELRDYFERLGVHAVTTGDTVRAHCAGTFDSRRAREEIEGYVDSWVKINRVPVQLT